MKLSKKKKTELYVTIVCNLMQLRKNHSECLEVDNERANQNLNKSIDEIYAALRVFYMYGSDLFEENQFFKTDSEQQQFPIGFRGVTKISSSKK